MFINQMNIKNLLESDWSADIQECIVTIRSKITDIINYFRWYYISCNVCSKKMTPANGVYPCLNCNKDCKFPLVKYKIHVKVEDNTGKTAFVLFNDVAEKILDTSAHKLFNKLSSLDNNDVPAHIQSLCGKDFIFKLKLNSYNLKEGLKNFTVSKLWIPYEKLELEYKLMKEKKTLIEDESEPKDRVPKELSTKKELLFILLLLLRIELNLTNITACHGKHICHSSNGSIIKHKHSSYNQRPNMTPKSIYEKSVPGSATETWPIMPSMRSILPHSRQHNRTNKNKQKCDTLMFELLTVGNLYYDIEDHPKSNSLSQ
ncbi:uncharacterized protein LOC107870416 isoform X1 [Capsicum annuum]|uniref:uncharacterized protein LOC107870416 isoform X1 n=1 Tax=Capsicum annuum TaxID=4072 RepID=UPI001FB13A9C|nr:uncharacterized protein LOC107870416 isoform X1 [Capsicum annuum]XP_047268562.1 uncharacterized protein LOC107870416 isoform X1 [Capsicum annuum]XP_047268563.1 uncharacterized protein LOC107870416 isoform X1 [Capsicum annuum]XP_047268564.1 uncharacterized protein LOC107870416 isoform X1 [Capsicum annuum]